MYDRMVGAVTMQSLYLEPDKVPGTLPNCPVVGLSPFMRSQMAEAVNLPLEYKTDRHVLIGQVLGEDRKLLL